MFPTAHNIAIAIVTSAQLHNEQPEAIARGCASRARLVAMAGLMAAFPDAPRERLGNCLGFPKPKNAGSQVITARLSKWWTELHVDEVVGAIVAEQYGEQAQ